jgi:hypothetical protein
MEVVVCNRNIKNFKVTLDINSIVDPDPHHLYTSQSASNKNQDPDLHQIKIGIQICIKVQRQIQPHQCDTDPQLLTIYLPWVLCLSVCDSVCVCVTICVGTLCYSFSFSNQTDQGDQTEGLEREGLRWRDGKGTDRRGRV